MSISSLSSRGSSFRFPEVDTARNPQTFGATPAADPSALANLFQDAFSSDPASGFGDAAGEGDGVEQLLEQATALIKTLEQLKDLLAPELGDEAPGAGQGGGQGVPQGGGQGVPQGGPQGVSPTQGAGKAPEGQVGDWIQEAQKVLAANGVPADKMKAEDIAKIIQHESSGNPNAVNNWDQNAKDGHPSKGLMQTIDSTFDAYKAPGHDDIFNPVDNIVAAVRYSVDKYGSVSNVPGLQAMNGGGGYVGY